MKVPEVPEIPVGPTPPIPATGKGFEAARSLVAEGKTREAALALGLDPDAIYASANMPKGESGAALAVRVADWGPEVLEKFSGPGLGAKGPSETKGIESGSSEGGTGGGMVPEGYTESEWQEFSDKLDAAGWSSISAQEGAKFNRGGLLKAIVHAPEEIIPQAIAQKGPGPISRAIEMLQLRGIRSAERSETNNNHVYIQGAQIRIDKVASDIDINRLLNLVDKQTRESIKNALAQRRT